MRTAKLNLKQRIMNTNSTLTNSKLTKFFDGEKLVPIEPATTHRLTD